MIVFKHIFRNINVFESFVKFFLTGVAVFTFYQILVIFWSSILKEEFLTEKAAKEI